MLEKSHFSNRGLGLLVGFSKYIEKSVTFYMEPIPISVPTLGPLRLAARVHAC